jgi:uncharacterized membrane protein
MMMTRKIGIVIITLSIALLATLFLIKGEIDSQSLFLCESVASNPSIEMSQCPAHTGNFSWMLVGASGIVFLLLGMGSYITMMEQATEKRKCEFKKIDEAKFDAEEKRLYRLIKDGEGSRYQMDLRKETQWSKVKITRILDRLETKGIIERKRRGMTNIIFLK